MDAHARAEKATGWARMPTPPFIAATLALRMPDSESLDGQPRRAGKTGDVVHRRGASRTDAEHRSERRARRVGDRCVLHAGGDECIGAVLESRRVERTTAGQEAIAQVGVAAPERSAAVAVHVAAPLR